MEEAERVARIVEAFAEGASGRDAFTLSTLAARLRRNGQSRENCVDIVAELIRPAPASLAELLIQIIFSGRDGSEAE